MCKKKKEKKQKKGGGRSKSVPGNGTSGHVRAEECWGFLMEALTFKLHRQCWSKLGMSLCFRM